MNKEIENKIKKKFREYLTDITTQSRPWVSVFDGVVSANTSSYRMKIKKTFWGKIRVIVEAWPSDAIGKNTDLTLFNEASDDKELRQLFDEVIIKDKKDVEEYKRKEREEEENIKNALKDNFLKDFS